jgi:hypothetical protein
VLGPIVQIAEKLHLDRYAVDSASPAPPAVARLELHRPQGSLDLSLRLLGSEVGNEQDVDVGGAEVERSGRILTAGQHFGNQPAQHDDLRIGSFDSRKQADQGPFG